MADLEAGYAAVGESSEAEGLDSWQSALLRRTDVARVAASIAGQDWLASERSRPIFLVGPSKTASITAAADAYKRLTNTMSLEEAAYSYSLQAWGRVEHGGASSDDELLMILESAHSEFAEWVAATFRRPGEGWDLLWDERSISLSGKTATVEYSCTPSGASVLAFKDEGATYKAKWEFDIEPSSGDWQVVGWPICAEFIASIENSLKRPSEVAWESAWWWMY
jgi:hypothetical protein